MKLAQFINPQQLKVICDLCDGEEGEFFVDKLAEVQQIINLMPKTYQSDAQSDGALVSLHYFLGNSDWWIIERDRQEDQEQAFGFVCINGDKQCAELGYISIVELLELGAELDLYWKIKTIGDVMSEFYGRREAA